MRSHSPFAALPGRGTVGVNGRAASAYSGRSRGRVLRALLLTAMPRSLLPSPSDSEYRARLGPVRPLRRAARVLVGCEGGESARLDFRWPERRFVCGVIALDHRIVVRSPPEPHGAGAEARGNHGLGQRHERRARGRPDDSGSLPCHLQVALPSRRAQGKDSRSVQP